jgi:hypothetical protein
MRDAGIVNLGGLSFADLTQVCADLIPRKCKSISRKKLDKHSFSGYDPSTQKREASSTSINFVKKEITIMRSVDFHFFQFFQVVDRDTFTDTEGLLSKI